MTPTDSALARVLASLDRMDNRLEELDRLDELRCSACGNYTDGSELCPACSWPEERCNG